MLAHNAATRKGKRNDSVDNGVKPDDKSHRKAIPGLCQAQDHLSEGMKTKEGKERSEEIFRGSKSESVLGIPPRIEKYERVKRGQQALDKSPTNASEINTVSEFRIDCYVTAAVAR